MDNNRLKMIIKYLNFDTMTDWDIEFMESVERQMDQKGKLSIRQEEIVEKIWRKRLD